MFDGDEMNIHLAQSVQARNELKRIANVKYQIIAAKDSNPIIGCVQDALSGSYLLTKLNNKIPGTEVANFLCNTSSDTKFEIEKDKLYTGHEIFSHIIPKGINNVIIKNDKKAFEIADGELKYGTLDKSTLSTVKNSIIHFIWDKYGPDKTRRFIDDVQRLALAFLNYRGFSFGIKDCMVDDKMENNIKEMVSNKVLEYNVALTQYENETDQIDPAIVEANLSSELNAFSSDVGSLVFKSLTTDNNLFVCVDSKSKGSVMNVQHVMGCVGQKSVEGARIKKKVENRSLPIFHKDDDTPEARGFIKTSFTEGLKSYEFFYDAMAGREGLIDTAIKSVTWETPIIIIENNEPKYIEIGRWIDNLIDNNKDKVKHHEERQMELLDTGNIYIPTTDYDGNVTWGEISAVTRHDPGTELYEIKTDGGRSVIVTESKSLLVWNDKTNQFKEKLTPEIIVGDYVPVTQMLKDPPIIKTYVEVSNYLPKTKYIYGTDYHKAITKMKNDMGKNGKIPNGWWQSNNGVEFTLPYTKKSSLQRCLIRSNQENIIDGGVYAYDAFRNNSVILDKFQLNEENGIFIGLFLAEGSLSNNNIRISNNNENVRNFIKNWFNKYSIKWDEDDKINKIGGRSISIRGYSTVLSSFITGMVNNGSSNKHVPTEAFTAPEEFIIGLLNGYFSGDGCITKNSIDASSASKRLIEGILMLCSRIGVFGKMYMSQLKENNLKTKNIKPSYRLRISAQWAKIFSEKITLLEDVRNKKMKEKKWSESHKNFKTFNNVVLDKISEIKLVDVKDHPKVYDLTIPSTFNFGLANGLQVRDTASTGYLQRQLIKGLEDLSIKYDNTNRNAKNIIIQYVYGENGIEQSSQTELIIGLISLNNKDIESTFGFNDDEIKKLEKEHKIKDLDKFNKKYLKRITEYRDNLRRIQSVANNNYKTLEEKYMLPVNLKRLTQDYSKNKVNLDLKPEEVLEAIDDILDNQDTKILTNVKSSSKLLKEDDRSLKYLFEIALHDYLCPKKCIFKYGLSKKDLNDLVKEIKLSFIKALVQPGEMVGIVAAQSIGEPTSQITLNTKHSAGVAAKSSTNMGVSRIDELLHYSKDIKTPQMVVYFNDDISDDRTKVNKISSYLTHLTIKELINSAEIYYDTGSEMLRNDNVANPFFANNQKSELSSMPFVFRLKLNMEKMHDKETTLLDIKTKFISHWVKNFTNLKNMKKNEKDIFTKINRCAILSNNDVENQIIHVRFSMSSFNYNLLTDFLKIVLEQITLKGIAKIDNSDLINERKLVFNKDGDSEVSKEHIVYTAGINMEKLKYIKGINHSRTTCNDVSTIYRLYGIEGARQILVNEFNSTFGDSKINHSHMSVLIDMMTHTGGITSIDRHGLSKIDSDPISKASFEMTMDHFLSAAIFNDQDHLQSVSSRIMLGRVIPGGTGAFELLLDTDKLENSEYTKDEVSGRVTFPALEEESLFKDILKYGFSKNDFFLPLK
jgi:DNA-directed RNA polymerase beta' subunit